MDGRWQVTDRTSRGGRGLTSASHSTLQGGAGKIRLGLVLLPDPGTSRPHLWSTSQEAVVRHASGLPRAAAPLGPSPGYVTRAVTGRGTGFLQLQTHGKALPQGAGQQQLHSWVSLRTCVHVQQEACARELVQGCPHSPDGALGRRGSRLGFITWRGARQWQGGTRRTTFVRLPRRQIRGNICREIHAHKGPKAGKTDIWLQKSGKGFPLVAGDRGSERAPGSL